MSCILCHVYEMYIFVSVIMQTHREEIGITIALSQLCLAMWNVAARNRLFLTAPNTPVLDTVQDPE